MDFWPEEYNFEPCIGMLEFSSVATGLEAADAISKFSSVRILACRTVSPGKQLTLFTGPVEEVRSGLRAGREGREDFLADELMLPQVHEDVFAALENKRSLEGLDPVEREALGILETFTLSGAIEAADKAAKTGRVTLLYLRLGLALGGKSYFYFVGETSNTETAVAAAADVAREGARLVNAKFIPQFHDDLLPYIVDEEGSP